MLVFQNFNQKTLKNGAGIVKQQGERQTPELLSANEIARRVKEQTGQTCPKCIVMAIAAAPNAAKTFDELLKTLSSLGPASVAILFEWLDSDKDPALAPLLVQNPQAFIGTFDLTTSKAELKSIIKITKKPQGGGQKKISLKPPVQPDKSAYDKKTIQTVYDQKGRPLIMTEKILYFGDTPVKMRIYRPGGAQVQDKKEPQVVMFNIHDDEKQILQAGLVAINDVNSGVIVELHHLGTRYVKFKVGPISKQIDPNRIFSDQEMKKQFKIKNRAGKLVNWAPEEVYGAVRQFRKQVNELLFSLNPNRVLTLHNARHLSIKAYQSGKTPDCIQMDKIHVGDPKHKRQLFFITHESDLKRLSLKHYNVIPQDNKKATKTGMSGLSAYFAGLPIPYVCVETQLDSPLPGMVSMIKDAARFGEEKPALGRK